MHALQFIREAFKRPLLALRSGLSLSLPNRVAPGHFLADSSGMRVSSHQHTEDQFPNKLGLTEFVFEGVYSWSWSNCIWIQDG